MKFSSFDSETDEDHTYSDDAGKPTDHIDTSCPLAYASDNKHFYEDIRIADYIFTSEKKFYLCQLT